MIPSSPLKNDDLFQITNINNKIESLFFQKSSLQKSKNQSIVFIVFIIIILISSFLQCQISNSFSSNAYVKNFYGNFALNPYNLLTEIENTSKHLIQTVYSLNSNKNNLSNPFSYLPITNIRIIVKRRCYDSPDISCENKQSFKTFANNSYVYDSEIGGFPLFIQTLQNSTLETHLKKIDDLLADNILDNFTKQVSFDVSFINPTTYMITYSELIYTISQLGVVKKKFNNFSFRYDYYQFPLDIFRAVCEVFFLFFYLFYFMGDFIAIYYEIKHSKIIKDRQKENDMTKSHNKRNKCYDFLYQVFEGFWQHMNRFGNILNFFINIIGFFIILLWLEFISNTDVGESLKHIDYKNLSSNEFSYLNDFNQKIKQKEDLQNNGYFYLIGSFLFFQFINLIVDLMRFSEIGNFYLFLIMNVFKKVVLFLVFLFVFFSSFAIFLKNIFGLNISELSDGYVAGLYLFKILLSDDSQIEAMWGTSPLITTFFYITYFLLIVFILMNMFLVITKNEFLSAHKNLLDLNEKIKKPKERKNPFDYKLCFIAKIKKYFNIFKLSLLFCLNKNKYANRKKELESFQEQINQESKIYSELDFNTDFNTFLKDSNKSANQALTDVEKLVQKKDKKRNFVMFIWKTLVMTITFIIFSTLITYYFDSSTNFSIINDINMKVTFTPSPPHIPPEYAYQNLMQINSRSQCIYFLQNIFPYYFSPYIYIENKNSTINPENINYGLLDHVFLINNVIRLTVRKRKYETIASELESLFPYKITSTFPRNFGKNEAFENTSDVFIPHLNRTVTYNSEESYLGLGGYVIYDHFSNDSFKELITGLFDSGFLDVALNSIVVDFITASFQEKGRFTKTNIYFDVDDSGVVSTHVYIMTFFRNAIEEVYDVLILITLILISLLYLLFFLKTFSNVLSRKRNYDTWFTLYIRNRLPKVLLYHREMQNAEILRKLKFIFNFKLMINMSFLIFGGGFLIAVSVYELQIFLFESNAMIFNQSVKNFLYNQIFYKPQTDSFIINHYGLDMNATSAIMITNGFVIFFASCSAFVLAGKIIFYYSKNESFYLIIQTLKRSFLDFLVVLIIFFGILMAFVLCTYFAFGMEYSEFSNFDVAFYNLLVPMVYFENLGVSILKDDKLLFIMLLLPYFITFKLVWLNLIISIMFKNFQNFLDQNKTFNESKNMNLSLKEFIYISLDLIKIMKKNTSINVNQIKYQDIILQTLQKVNIHLPFISMKNSIKNSDRLKNVNVWADVCSEEIRYEYDSRKFLKDKCDEIIKNTVNSADEFGEDPEYVQLNQITFKRIPIEFELRKVFWEYFRIAHLYFHRYDYYLQQKIDEIMKSRKINDFKSELSVLKVESLRHIEGEDEKNREEDEVEKLNVQEILMKLEENLKNLKKLREEEKILTKKKK